MPETIPAPHLLAAIRQELLARTPSSRVPHVMGVEGMAVVLARRWGVEVERTLLAALLHDLAKALAPEVQRERLAACTVVPPTPEDWECAPVWHGLLAAQEAHDVYGVTDRDVLEAVAWHSTGAPDLGDVGLVLYVADFLEPSRNWPAAPEHRRRLTALPLTAAALEVARHKLQSLLKKGRVAHPRTHELRRWLESRLEKGG